jgi:hypothetical protein
LCCKCCEKGLTWDGGIARASSDVDRGAIGMTEMLPGLVALERRFLLTRAVASMLFIVVEHRHQACFIQYTEVHFAVLNVRNALGATKHDL